MKIVLPWPNPKLTPNAKRRTHWRTYQPAIKDDRRTGHLLTYKAFSEGEPLVHGPLTGEGHIRPVITFYPPDARHRDDDGMIAAFKHLRDGICDALAVNDRRFRPHYVIAEPEKPGRVEVVF